MRGGTIQINWHDTKPVLTLDFHSLTGNLATGGSDNDIKLWVIAPGKFLASGSDGGELVIWKLHSADDGSAWKVFKTLLFHRKDVLDLQWSPDGGFLVSGSVDNSCIIWDVNKGSVHQILDAHLHYVQGVSWDPLGCYVASLSSDRTCRIYVNKPQTKQKGYENINFVSQYVLTKLEVQNMDDSMPPQAKTHLFHDETLNSFFRRLSWSPDGSFLLVPAGMYKFSPASDPINAAYIISRKDLSRPAVNLLGASKPIVAVRFCPILFCLQGSNTASLFKLPYRVIFAVATFNSLYIYDSESSSPIVIVAGLHYAAITDISWSPNAKYLALSSQDGYCSILEFDDDELGVPFSSEDSRSASECISCVTNMKADIEDKMDIDHTGAAHTNMKAGLKADEEEQIPPNLVRAPDTNKPTKKRITPVAVTRLMCLQVHQEFLKKQLIYFAFELWMYVENQGKQSADGEIILKQTFLALPKLPSLGLGDLLTMDGVY